MTEKAQKHDFARILKGEVPSATDFQAALDGMPQGKTRRKRKMKPDLTSPDSPLANSPATQVGQNGTVAGYPLSGASF